MISALSGKKNIVKSVNDVMKHINTALFFHLRHLITSKFTSW